MDLGTLKTQIGNRIPGMRSAWHKAKRTKQRLLEGKAEGIVLMLHRVGELDPSRLDSNENMKISPARLQDLINVLQDSYAFIRSEDILTYVKEPHKKPFVVITLDDAYKDNLDIALPIFEKNNAPFTVFAASDFISGKGFLWWYKLEEVLLKHDHIKLSDGTEYSCASKQEKEDTFLELRNRILSMNPLECENQANQLFSPYEQDWNADFNSVLMNWDELISFSKHPLVTIGAHTKHHYNLKNLPTEQDVLDEIQAGTLELSQHGIHPTVFAYPFGSKNEVSEREIRLAGQCGFQLSFISFGDLVTSKNIQSPMEIHRILIDDHVNLKELTHL